MALGLSGNLGNARFRYLDIIEALAHRIREGGLVPGTRLPTQRAVADQFGVSIATVNRAYIEAARQGLVIAHVGRGTFVAEDAAHAATPGAAVRDSERLDLTTNRWFFTERTAPLLQRAVKTISGQTGLDNLMRPQPGPGHVRHRTTGCQWLARVGVETTPDEVVICNGLQHGLSLVLTALAQPGDVILTEELTYPGIKLLDQAHGIRVRGLPIDDNGLSAEAVDEACTREGARFLVCTPSVHNPTNVMMGDKRRRQLAEIAQRHDLIIIECDNNEIPPAHPLKPLCSFAEERSFHISSAWRVSGFGIHLGFIRTPQAHAGRIATALRATTWLISPLLAEIFSIWMGDGTIEQILDWHRTENARRLDLARRILASHDIQIHADSPNVWVTLPAPWRSEDFAGHAEARGVLVTTADMFAVGRTIAPHAVRISLGGARDLSSLEQGLRDLSDILAEGPHPARLVL
ncbi:MAG: PLP-dependent aminotransferase family protein [Alphaproteobacteria bacterium]|nr:PLP-dependent aminotransferase family protein [Alphaproteobacteria bacterium]